MGKKKRKAAARSGLIADDVFPFVITTRAAAIIEDAYSRLFEMAMFPGSRVSSRRSK